MFTSVEFARAFFQTFDGSAIDLFRRYLQRNPGVRKWMIAADFSLSDPARFFDCFAFTFWPYDDWPDRIAADAVDALPKDLKNTKILTPEAAAWLKDSRRFHVVVAFNKRRPVFYNGPESNALAVAREHVRLTLEALEQRAVDEESRAQITRFKSLKAKSDARGFNTKLLANIWVLAQLFAILTFVLGREGRSEVLGWFPDRDDMTNWCDGIWRDYTFGSLHALCDAFAVDMRNTRTVAAGPDRSGPQEVMWFDHMIRAADWLAGVVGAWNPEANLVPGHHPKYQHTLEQVIADSDNIIVIKGSHEEKGLQFSRIAVQRDQASECSLGRSGTRNCTPPTGAT